MGQRTVICWTSKEEQILRQWARAGTSEHRMVERAKVILLAHQGKSHLEIAEHLKPGPLACRSGVNVSANEGSTVCGTQIGRAARPTMTKQPRNGC